jgi:hypothetical protein
MKYNIPLERVKIKYNVAQRGAPHSQNDVNGQVKWSR